MGFLKGLKVNILRAILVNAAELASYDQAKSTLIGNFNMRPDSLYTHFLSSTAAGMKNRSFQLKDFEIISNTKKQQWKV